jgi:hypothetical protein
LETLYQIFAIKSCIIDTKNNLGDSEIKKKLYLISQWPIEIEQATNDSNNALKHFLAVFKAL